MTIIIKIYILLCLALLLFDICFLIVKNRRSLVAYRVNEKLGRRIREEIGTYQQKGDFSPDFREKLHQELAKTKNLLTLESVLAQQPQAREWFRPFVFNRMKEYAAKDDYEQAYYTYVLSCFDYQEQKPKAEFVDSLLDFLDSKSLYTFANTMNCLYAIGLPQPLLRALEKIDQRQGFYHKKLLVDGLLTVRQEDGELDRCISGIFDRCSPWLQDCLLDYFRLRGTDVSQLCLRIITGDQADTQVGYTAMRYFAKYPSPESRACCLNVLADDSASWLRQMLAIQTLGRYDDAEVRKTIFGKVTSANWYIRVNAIRYLGEKGLTRDEVFNLLYLRDRYANESVLYQYRGDKEMTRYIVDTIQLLEIQDGTAKTSRYLDAQCDAASV